MKSIRNIQSMKDYGLIDEQTMPTKKQLIGYQFYTQSMEGSWGDIDKLITDNIGIMRKDNFIKAYAMAFETTADIAQKAYSKALSKRKKMIRDGYIPKTRKHSYPKPPKRNLLMLGF